MNFSIDPEIFKKWPELRVGVVIVNGATNAGAPGAYELLQSVATQANGELAGQTMSEIPQVAVWREAYREFGAKPKDYPSSIEALLKRVSKSPEMNSISPLVDIYNAMSIKHRLPAGGEDVDMMIGNLRLTFAGPDEIPVQVLGKDEEQAPKDGEVIYKDDAGTICRRWNWREVERTVITTDTTNLILVMEALGPDANASLEPATDELAKTIEQLCGGTITQSILTADSPAIEL